MKEQSGLEQQAKRHLEEELRSDIEEKEHIIEALKTKVTLLKVSFFPTPIYIKCFRCTGPENNACTWFVEVGYCCCLPLLPQLACNILATTYK